MPEQTAVEKTSVLIIGGGPVGLTLSAQLGGHGIDNILVNKNTHTSTHPKCNLANARSMEHFRRLGVSERLREVGLPSDHPQDVVYFTRLGKPEITRIPIQSSNEAMAGAQADDARWPTPEPPYRVSQIFIEDVLKRHADTFPSSTICFGWQLIDFTDAGNLVRARVKSLETTEEKVIEAKWMVGCDGGSGIVRTKLGINYEGDGRATRAFMGGTMLATYFSSPELTRILERHRPGHMLWAYNRDFVSATVRINGWDTFLTHIQIPPDDDPEAWNPEEFIPRIVGEPIALEVISKSPWNAGFQLVAERLQKGRCLIAGDAAHLFTPTGGFGMNTGIDDVANLSWKLAADIKGWAGPKLVASYCDERQPIGRRNTEAAKRIADIMGNIRVPDDIEDQGAAAETTRQRLIEDLQNLAAYEYQTTGVQLGVRYNRSRIVLGNPDTTLPDDIIRYVPSAEPGSRAPHAFIEGQTSLYDLLGDNFTLLNFGCGSEHTIPMLAAAAERRVPVKLLDIDDDKVAELYQNRLVLIRPDMHVAWRGDLAPADPLALFDRVRGA